MTTANEITTFFHCRTCLEEKPPNISPRDWVRPEVGFTPAGIQVWCVRCEKNIGHFHITPGAIMRAS